MLNRTHSAVSSKYNKLLQKLVSSLRHTPGIRNDFDKIVARFIRWCALHASGGGWMSDYDVLNKGFTPKDAIAIKDTMVLFGSPSFAFYVSEENAQNVVNKYLIEDILSGESVRSECDILGIQPIRSELLFHAKKTSDVNRSSLMKEEWDGLISKTTD